MEGDVSRPFAMAAEPGCQSGIGRERHHDALRELCHDLLQPAATIGAVVTAAQVEADLPAATKARLNQVTLEARRIADLCRQVLLEGESRSAVLLHELADEVATAASVGSPGAVTVQAQPAVVHGDPTSLRRALSNLVSNAARAAGNGGKVVVSVAVVGHRAEVRVADSGGGFGKGESGVAGLGLRIAARVAHEHGGELALGCSAELGGAEVVLSFPSMFVGEAEREVSEGGVR